MNKGKYIFLDVDGVLNHHETYKKKHANSLYPDLDPECLALFSKLVYSIDYVHIVLSSSWRLIESDINRLEAAFKEFGIPKWIDITPYLEYEQGKTKGFRSLNQDIQTIINKSEAVKKAKKEGGEKTQKEKKELSDEEKNINPCVKRFRRSLSSLLLVYRYLCISPIIVSVP